MTNLIDLTLSDLVKKIKSKEISKTKDKVKKTKTKKKIRTLWIRRKKKS